jgi:phage protein D
VQQGTDLAYILEMARRFDYVFYVSPGPVPGMNLAYWGPPVRQGLPQKALSFNLGPSTNVTTLDFQNNANSATTVSGSVQDRSSNQATPVQTMAPSRIPLSAEPPNAGTMRTTLLRESGTSTTQAMAHAQATTDNSTNEVVTATGELDAAAYGDLLQARALVGLRGAGQRHDGLYYVKEVTHTIARGEYKQKFTLTREGLGATLPVVRP